MKKISISWLIACLITAGMLVFALTKLPYDYYKLLRFIVFGTASYGAFMSIKIKVYGWIWILGIIALIFNPIIPVYLSKGIWAVIDIITALIFIISIFIIKNSD